MPLKCSPLCCLAPPPRPRSTDTRSPVARMPGIAIVYSESPFQVLGSRHWGCRWRGWGTPRVGCPWDGVVPKWPRGLHRRELCAAKHSVKHSVKHNVKHSAKHLPLGWSPAPLPKLCNHACARAGAPGGQAPARELGPALDGGVPHNPPGTVRWGGMRVRLVPTRDPDVTSHAGGATTAARCSGSGATGAT